MRDIAEIDKPYRETDEYKRNARIAREQNAIQSACSKRPGHTWGDVPFEDQRPDESNRITGDMGWGELRYRGFL